MKKNIEETFENMISRLYITNKPLGSHKHSIKSITWQVTDACNLRCSYCYQISKHNNMMTWDVAKRFCDLLLNATHETCSYVNKDDDLGITIEFIGGEPFLNVDIMDKVCDYMINQMIQRHHPWLYFFKISISTNGTLYFEPEVQNFIRKYFSFISLSVTVDGNKELHDSCRLFPDGSGSYDKAMAAVNHYTNVLGGYMGSKLTIAPGNINYLCDAVTNLINNNYKQINLNCVYEEGWTQQHATVLYTQLCKIADYIISNNLFDEIDLSIFAENGFHAKIESDNENWCGGNGVMLACDWKGDLYPCIRYMESSLGTSQPEIVIGNVYHGIESTTEEQERVKCLQCITRRSQSTDECYYCPIAEQCAWCSGYNYQVFGTPNKRATYICEMHKARALANAYFFNMYFLYNNKPNAFLIHVPEEWAIPIIGEEEWIKLKTIEAMALDKSRLEEEDKTE